MNHDNDFFIPEQVDAQVDLFSQPSEMMHLSRASQAAQPDKGLVKDLQAYYQVEQEQDLLSLERSWQRIARRLPAKREISQITDKAFSAKIFQLPGEKDHKMQNDFSEQSAQNIPRVVSVSPRQRRGWRLLGSLAAVLVAALLVGSLMTVLSLNRQAHTSKVAAEPTSTPQSLPVGTTVYTTPGTTNEYYNSLAWSPDSTHVATSTDNVIRIWDATTGKHQVTISLGEPDQPGTGGTPTPKPGVGGTPTVPGSRFSLELVSDLAWSPDSQFVAIATNKEIVIVNGQSGKIVRSYTQGVSALHVTTTSGIGQSPLASLSPESGFFGYQATAWSPDGKLMASATAYGESGAVQVWNPQTGASSFTLQTESKNVVGSIAWSSDGQYLAAQTTAVGASTPNNWPESQIVVWDTTTHQIVFQQTDSTDQYAQVVWQPDSHILAWTGRDFSGAFPRTALEIWNVATGRQVQQFVDQGSDKLSWSPDGKQIVCSTPAEDAPAVVILDATTGQIVYSYKGNATAVSVLSWSPDGKYIASGGGAIIGTMVNGQQQTLPTFIKVWVA